MNEQSIFITRVIALLGDTAPVSPPEATRSDAPFDWQWLATADAEMVQQVATYAAETPIAEWITQRRLMADFCIALIRRQIDAPVAFPVATHPLFDRLLKDLHQTPSAESSIFPTLLLRSFALSNSAKDLQQFARWIVLYPPQNQKLLVEIFGDLVRNAQSAAAVFPPLLQGLEHPSLASFSLEFANFLRRESFVTEHPAKEQLPRLGQLLSGIAGRLGQLQEMPRPQSPDEMAQLGRQVHESVTLGVSLCDAMGLIGNPQALGSLHQILEVEHRRLRVEAAAALCRLKIDGGKELLVSLASEPTERMRVLQYAAELEIEDDVDKQYASAEAQAEAQMVMYLAHPSKFGLPPRHIELVDTRTISWPGQEQPQTCHLFQFAYPTDDPQIEYVNIGLMGLEPLSFDVDLTQLSHDDIFALFAGWSVDSPDVGLIAWDTATGSDLDSVRDWIAAVEAADNYRAIDKPLIGQAWEHRVLVLPAEQGTDQGWLLVGDDQFSWLPGGDPTRPLQAHDAFHIFVGRLLFITFPPT